MIDFPATLNSLSALDHPIRGLSNENKEYEHWL
jgi:hypothetical protein